MVLPVKVFEVRGLEGDPRDTLMGWREVEELEDEELVEYYDKALWLEERNAKRLARAVNKGFWGE